MPPRSPWPTKLSLLHVELLEARVVPAGFTDNFESATLDPFWSVSPTPGATASLSTAQAHGGQQSVKFSTAANGVQKGIQLDHRLASLTLGRVSVWVYDS